MTGFARRLPFEGATNFRDLGGYPALDGRITRWGRVFRADGLHALTPSDLVRYEQLGVRVAYDLRRAAERESLPTPVPNMHLCLMALVEEARGADYERTVLTVPDDGERLLRESYAGMLAHSAPVFGQLFAGLADPSRLPAVFHCHGGKDRTGLAAALLLELLGVDRETVLDDYELTGEYRTRDQQAGSYEALVASGMPPEAAAAVLGTPRWAMADTLADLDEVHGGVEAYLTGPAGLDHETMSRIRALLVE